MSQPVVLTTELPTPEGPIYYTFQWTGPYIEVTFPGALCPTDCIRVWDMDDDRAHIHTVEDFVSECESHRDRMMNNEGHDLERHIEQALDYTI